MNPTLTVLVLIIVLILLILLIVLGVWWYRRRHPKPSATAPQTVAALDTHVFKAAIDEMYSDRNRHKRYNLPCALVCTEPGGNASSVLDQAQLAPVFTKSSQETGWWQSSYGTAFALPGVAMGEDGTAHHAWDTCLKLLSKHRSRRAIDCLVWILPLSHLQGSDEKQLKAIGERMRQRFYDMQTRLAVQVPIYVVISECESIGGFGKWASHLSPSLQAQCLGWSNPQALGNRYNKELIDRALESITAQLRRLVAEMGAQKTLGDDYSEMFVFPDHLQDALQGLPVVLASALGQTYDVGSFDLRSIHLVGSAQADTRNNEFNLDPFDVDPLQPAELSPPVFCKILFSRRIFAEFGLAKIARRERMHADSTFRRTIWISAICASVWLICIISAYFYSLNNVRIMLPALTRVQSEILHGNEANHRQTVKTLQELVNVAHWDPDSVFIPLSWAGKFALNQKILDDLQKYCETDVLPSIDQTLQSRLDALGLQRSTSATGLLARSSAPVNMPEFLALNDYVDQVLTYENFSNQYSDLTGKIGDNYAAVPDLLSYVFQIDVKSTNFPFETVIKACNVDPVLPGKESEARARLNKHLLALHDALTNRLFYQNPVKALSTKLDLKLQSLDQLTLDSPVELAELQKMITDLNAILAQTNSAWMMQDGSPFGDEYQKLMQKVTKSKLLGGPSTAQSLQNDANAAQREFSDKIIQDASGLDAIFDVSQGKPLTVKAELVDLSAALNQLMQHAFAKSAAQKPNRLTTSAANRLIVWDLDALQSGSLVYEDYLAYESTQLPKAPARFQPALHQIASKRAATMIDANFSLAALEAQGGNAGGTVNFDRAQKLISPMIAAFKKLDQPAFGLKWKSMLNQQAYNLLENIDELLDQKQLYQPNAEAIAQWSGDKHTALMAYSIAGPSDLRDYLDTQLAFISELNSLSKAPREWLENNDAVSDGAAASIKVWKQIDANLAKYAAKAPGANVLQLEQSISNLDDLETANCSEKLNQAGLRGNDFFQLRAQQIANQFLRRCQSLQTASVQQAYATIAEFYNTHLRDRYPFSESVDATEADPEQVERFLRVLDVNLPVANEVLRHVQPTGEAADFLTKLSNIRPLLSAMLTRDPATRGYPNLDLWPEFRVNQKNERGAENVIEWGMGTANTDAIKVQNGQLAKPLFSWRIGDPLVLSLRWANNSPIGPIASPQRFPRVAIEGKKAIWRYQGSWALLWLLRDHAAPLGQIDPAESSVPQILGFGAATSLVDGSPAGDANVFARLGVTLHGKSERYAYVDFPTGPAPAWDQKNQKSTTKQIGAK